MLDRNRQIKPQTSGFQKCKHLFDWSLTCKETVYDQVMEDLNSSEQETCPPVHVTNVDLQDNQEEATQKVSLTCELRQGIRHRRTGEWDGRAAEVQEEQLYLPAHCLLLLSGQHPEALLVPPLINTYHFLTPVLTLRAAACGWPPLHCRSSWEDRYECRSTTIKFSISLLLTSTILIIKFFFFNQHRKTPFLVHCHPIYVSFTVHSSPPPIWLECTNTYWERTCKYPMSRFCWSEKREN